MSQWFFVRSGRPAGEVNDRAVWAVMANSAQEAIHLCEVGGDGEDIIEPDYEFSFAERCVSQDEALGKVAGFYEEN